MGSSGLDVPNYRSRRKLVRDEEAGKKLQVYNPAMPKVGLRAVHSPQPFYYVFF